MTEKDFIDALRRHAVHPAARGLLDDAAVLEVGGVTLVLTHDMIVEGVHFLPDDPPGDVAWKLLAVNLSDLAAKGARPIGALLGYSLGDDDWDRNFVDGLAAAMSAFGIALLGGDTVSAPTGTPRSLGLTAIGEAPGPIPSRGGARAGDQLWVTGALGDAGAGLRLLRGEIEGPDALVERYRNPRPRLEAGQRLASLVSAMMDVSDGLLIDSRRMAEASGAALRIDLATIPLSAEYLETLGDGREARLFAATAGDDYELLFTASPERATELLGLADELGLPLSIIGRVEPGCGLLLSDGQRAVALPERLGWEHHRSA
jgi:thiamine-monophosphate kinase